MSDASAALQPPRAGGAGPPEPALRILVVDDDGVDRTIVRRALARAGVRATIDEAEGVPDAAELLRPGAYDCVFLDYNIPGGDGLTLLRRVRGAGVDTPVVMLTGQGGEQVAVALMKAGATDYLSKAEITPERLAASLRYALELSRAEAEKRRAEAALRESAGQTRFLAEASRVLGASLDLQATLRTVARLAVPLLGDFCVIYLAEGDDRSHRGIAAAHADPAKEPLVRALERRYRPDPEHPTSYVAEVIRTGRTRVVDPIPEAHAETIAESAEDLEVFRALEPRAGLFVALVAREHVLGAVGFLRSAPGSGFPPAHVALAEDLAQRAAMAIDNARLYEEAARARASAEQANRAKSDFLARMSHDLRTPLNAIGGYAQLLEMGVHGPVSEAQRDAIARIVRAQEHLLTLINDILSFARLEAGQVQIDVGDVALDGVLRELDPLVQPLLAAREIAYVVPDGADRVYVRADAARLLQVLVNLVTNAAKFTAPGGRVELGWTAGPETVSLEVSDTGCGIAPERLEAIFTPFVQAGNSAADTGQGVGLGLAIGRELMRLMQGDLTVRSVPGEGSTFTVTLPRSSPAPFPDPPAPAVAAGG